MIPDHSKSGQTPLPFAQVAVLMGVRLAEPSKPLLSSARYLLIKLRFLSSIHWSVETGAGASGVLMRSSDLSIYQPDDRGARDHRQPRSSRVLFRSSGEFVAHER